MNIYGLLQPKTTYTKVNVWNFWLMAERVETVQSFPFSFADFV